MQIRDKLRGIGDKLRDVRMWKTRRKWRKEGELRKQKEAEERTAVKRRYEGLCEKAGDQAKRLCASLVSDAELSPQERGVLAENYRNKIVSTRENSDNYPVARELAAKGLVEELPSKGVLKRFIFTGRGNCVAKLESGEPVSECDCSPSSVLEALETLKEHERKASTYGTSYR